MGYLGTTPYPSREVSRTAPKAVRPWRATEPSRETESVVLIIDDDPNNLGIMTDFLQEFNYTILVAEDGESGVQRAAYAQPDLILLDVMMPGIDGYETCRRLKSRESTRDIPVICMTALAEIENKLKGFEAGVVDYITKPYQREEVLARVDAHLRLRKATRELKEARDHLEVRVEERTAELEAANLRLEQEVAEHRRTGKALRESERKFQAIFDNAFQHMGLMAPDGTVLAANRTALSFTGLKESDVVGRSFWDAPWWSYDAELKRKLKRAVADAAQGTFVRFEVTHRSHDLTLQHFDFSIKPVLDEEGRVVMLIPEGRDITDRIKLAEQLRHSQKMEAVGTLAGGVAHDFNNILTAIIGFGSLLGMHLEEGSPLRDFLDQMMAAADRAATLTGSLLSFSRKDAIEPGPMRLNETVASIEKFLMRIIGEDIRFRTELHRGDLVINSDRGHIEQILMNLAVNARDAMPNGGTLLVSTERVEVTDPFPGFLAGPGSYAVLSVSDTGEGMAEQTKQRIFEPFFTTKEVGKGTGLGLSIVYGIVQQHEGHIEVFSEPGLGTTFKIFLRLIGAEVEKGAAARPLALVGGTETVLLAEDDADVTVFMTQTLREHGYTVIESCDGEEAVRKFAEHERDIDLVILDVVMPRMNGQEVYQRIRRSSAVPIMFASGYTSDIINQKGVLEEGVVLIPKPMTPYDLLSKVRGVLAGAAALGARG